MHTTLHGRDEEREHERQGRDVLDLSGISAVGTKEFRKLFHYSSLDVLQIDSP